MFNIVKPSAKGAALVAFSLAATITSQTVAQTEQVNKFEQLNQANAPSQRGLPFTSQEQTQIINRFLANPRMVERMRNQRVRVLSLVSGLTDKETTAPRSASRIARAVVFNYSTGNATRFMLDAASGEVLREEPLRGRPQASQEEIQEAMRIIQANPELARLLQTGGILEGGFIVDGPIGAPPRNRYIQMQVLTSDRSRIQKLVSVDLTRGIIV